MEYRVLFLFSFLSLSYGFEEFAETLELAKPSSDGIYEFELVVEEKLTMSTDGKNGAVEVLDYDPDDFNTVWTFLNKQLGVFILRSLILKMVPN